MTKEILMETSQSLAYLTFIRETSYCKIIFILFFLNKVIQSYVTQSKVSINSKQTQFEKGNNTLLLLGRFFFLQSQENCESGSGCDENLQIMHDITNELQPAGFDTRKNILQSRQSSSYHIKTSTHDDNKRGHKKGLNIYCLHIQVLDVIKTSNSV